MICRSRIKRKSKKDKRCGLKKTKESAGFEGIRQFVGVEQEWTWTVVNVEEVVGFGTSVFETFGGEKGARTSPSCVS